MTTDKENSNLPTKYDMTKPNDIKRWFREMEGYLKTENFINQGTDLEGRKFALEGFNQLKLELNRSKSQELRKRNPNRNDIYTPAYNFGWDDCCDELEKMEREE